MTPARLTRKLPHLRRSVTKNAHPIVGSNVAAPDVRKSSHRGEVTSVQCEEMAAAFLDGSIVVISKPLESVVFKRF